MSGRRRAVLFAVVAAAFVMQAAYGSATGIHGWRPNLGLCALGACALHGGESSAPALGFLLGLLEGSFAGRLLGSFLVSRTLAAAAVGYLGTRVHRDHPLAPALAAFVCVALAELLFFVFAPQPRAVRWAALTLEEAGYNTALALVLGLAARLWPAGRRTTPSLSRTGG